MSCGHLIHICVVMIGHQKLKRRFFGVSQQINAYGRNFVRLYSDLREFQEMLIKNFNLICAQNFAIGGTKILRC